MGNTDRLFDIFLVGGKTDGSETYGPAAENKGLCDHA